MSRAETGPGTELRTVPRRTLLADNTYAVLRDALITNRLAPGQRLTIDQLAQDLDVSTTPIRHALVRLEADGFVTRTPYKGYVASDVLNRATVTEIFRSRVLLETETAARAAERASDEDHAELARLASFDPAARCAEDEDQAADTTMTYDATLHRRIATVAGNRVIVEILATLDRRMAAYRTFRAELEQATRWDQTAKDLAATRQEHAAILAALKEGDAAAAQVAMRTHLDNASQRDIRRDTAHVPSATGSSEP